jgi:hypothetical protein
MFQNLGRMLTTFYFPQEAQQVEQAIKRRSGALDEEAASIQALGMSYETLGIGVARSWGLPDSLQRCMRRPRGEPPSAPPARAADRLRWVTLAANEVATALQDAEPAQADASVAAVAERFARVLDVSADDMLALTQQARRQLAQMARAMGLNVHSGAAARRLLDSTPREPAATAFERTLASHALHATLPLAELGYEAGSEPGRRNSTAQERAAGMMAAGIQDITNAMVENCKLDEVLRMVLETMLRALGLRRVLFCLREPRTEVISARFGLGEGIEAIVPPFKVTLKGATDLFAVVCKKGADTLITDATAPQIAARLPTWFVKHVNAPAFLLLPLAVKGVPFALIYADMAQPGGFELGEKELSLLRTLRNQAVMAFRQVG